MLMHRRRSGKNAYPDSVSLDHHYTRVIPNGLSKSSCTVSSVSTLPANIQTNPQCCTYTCQQRAFPFHPATHKCVWKGTGRIRTLSSLLVIDDRTHVLGHSPVPQADCTFFNLRRKILLDLMLS